MTRRVQTTGEIIAAHPSRVAQADQIQAALPCRCPSSVVLSKWLPTDRVYVINLDVLCALPDEPFLLPQPGEDAQS